MADPNKERPLDHLWLWFCFSVDNRLFFHVSQIFWLLNILCRTVETEVPSIYAWECTCLFLSQCSISPVRSWARFWFCCCYGYHQLHISVLYVVLRVGAGLLEGFSQHFCFMLYFLPCLCSCASEGGLSAYSFPSPGIDCCCLLVPARLVMGAGGIFCFPSPAFFLSRCSVAGPWEWGFLSISVPSPFGIYLLQVLCQCPGPSPALLYW